MILRCNGLPPSSLQARNSMGKGNENNFKILSYVCMYMHAWLGGKKESKEKKELTWYH